MIAFRRLGWNFALEHAAERARELGRPLVILEPLRCGYRWASDRFHRFVLDGMAEHARRLQGTGVLYHPYAEPAPGAGKGLLAALANRACLVVTDDSPAFFYPRMVRAAAEALERLPVRLEAVDSNGLLPLRAVERTFVTAYDFRRTLQKLLPHHLGEMPAEDPLADSISAAISTGAAVLPADVLRRWPAASAALLRGDAGTLAALPIDHEVAPVPEVQGGETAAVEVLDRFLSERLAAYGEGCNNLDEDVASGLSPYLHFGHIATHRVFAAVAALERWTPERLAARSNGAREGWWGMSPAAEKFLDELVTWREVGYNRSALQADAERFESLPDWARATLEKHAGDPRPELYDLAAFEAAATHDELWNAAQRQLAEAGRIHNYLRMLWGKKILHWSASPREALAVMLELNNKYALDGRDPNSASGIFWCLGRYDRPWPPERPVFGSVRYMSTESTRRKLKVDGYVARWSGGRAPARQLSLL
jgi:deoxyribodipyrimidine photo-lyase